MIKMEYFCACPICNKRIVGKAQYKNHIDVEVGEIVDKLNKIMPDLKEFNMSINVQKVPVSGLNYLSLSASKEKDNNEN